MTNRSTVIISKEDSQDSILQGAMELFASTGYHKTSVLSIAKKVGISSGLIFYHFETKDNLLKQVIITLLSRLDSIFDVDDCEKPEKKLELIIDRFQESLIANKTDWELYMAIIYQPDTKELIEPLVTESTRNFRRKIYDIYKVQGHPSPDVISLEFELFRIGVFASFLYTGDERQLGKAILSFKKHFIIN